MAKIQSKNRKYGRNKRKAANRGNATSLFVRGKITAHTYWAMAGIPAKV